VPHRDQFVATVRKNINICREHFRLTLHLDAFPPTAPGQFIQIECRNPHFSKASGLEREIDWRDDQPIALDGAELRAPLAFLRRPFSLAGRRDVGAGVELEIIHRVVGVGTDWMAKLKPDDPVGILGPLGNRFTLPQPGQTAVLVGGGVGIPPMLYLGEALKSRPAVAFSGATTRELLALSITSDADTEGTHPRNCIREFADCGIPSIITTDDGSYGFRGFITQALERWLDAQKNASLLLYTCGPEPMMKRVADIALARNIPCQIAVERAMACGMGTCQSCCIRVKKPDPAKPPLPGKEWCWRLACTDGPIFAASELLW
jgi:dihydroorotate dehydrogenase electron transfer subunit